jgi:hypothetical protein
MASPIDQAFSILKFKNPDTGEHWGEGEMDDYITDLTDSGAFDDGSHCKDCKAKLTDKNTDWESKSWFMCTPCFDKFMAESASNSN